MNIALIAHDAKKRLMENLCIAYRQILIKHKIFATGTTGRSVQQAANINVNKYLAGHLGGEQQLGMLITSNAIDLVIFFRDASARTYDAEGHSIMRLCEIYNIPFASNLATAEILLMALDRGDLDWRNIVK